MTHHTGETFLKWDDPEITTVQMYLKSVRKFFKTSPVIPQDWRPIGFEIVGSFLLHTTILQWPNVDVVLPMPQSVCNETTLRRHEYLHIRETYLKEIAKYFSSFGHAVILSDQGGSQCLPSFGEKTCLMYHIPETSFFLRIHACPILSEDQRRHLLDIVSRDHCQTKKANSEPLALDPSFCDVTYTNAVLEDVLMKDHLSELHRTATQYPTMISAISYIKSWCNLCGIPLSTLCISFLIQFLIQRGCVTQSTSWEQTVRIFFTFVAEEKLKDAFRKTLDSSGFNVMTRVTKCTESLLFESASRWSKIVNRSLRTSPHKLLNDAIANSYVHRYRRFSDCDDKHSTIPLWTQNLYPIGRIAHRFHHVLHIQGIQSPTKLCPLWSYVQLIMKSLEDALSDRIESTDFLWTDLRAPISAASGNRSGRPETFEGDIFACFRVRDERIFASRMMKGPLLEVDAEVEAFRAVWGAQVETRQFADGATRVVVLWPEDSPERIFLRAVRTLLERHHRISAHRVTMVGVDLNKMLPTCMHSKKDLFLMTQPQAAFTKLKDALYELPTVANFPVAIENIHACHAALRYTAIYPALPHQNLIHEAEKKIGEGDDADVRLTSKCNSAPTLGIVVTLGHHQKWPHHSGAVEQLVVSLQVEMAKILRKKRGLVCSCSPDGLYVVVQGFVFKVCLFYPPLVRLLRGVGDVAAADSLVRNYSILPSHAAWIRQIVDKYPTSGSVMRLLKHLVNQHGIAEYFLEEALELVVAAAYLSAAATDNPLSSLFMGWMHTLMLVAKVAWDEEPLILSDAPTSKDDPNKKDSRAPGPFPSTKAAMHIATPYDSNSIFTRVTPNRDMLNFFVDLCRRALGVCEGMFHDAVYTARKMRVSHTPHRTSLALDCETATCEIHQHEAGKIGSRKEETNVEFRPSKRPKSNEHTKHSGNARFVPSTADTSLAALWLPTFTPQWTFYDILIELNPSMFHTPAPSSFNIYEKGIKDRSKRIHLMVTYDPLREIIKLLRAELREKVLFFRHVYFDARSPTLDTRCVIAACFLEPFYNEGDSNPERESLLKRMVEICGEAYHRMSVFPGSVRRLMENERMLEQKKTLECIQNVEDDAVEKFLEGSELLEGRKGSSKRVTERAKGNLPKDSSCPGSKQRLKTESKILDDSETNEARGNNKRKVVKAGKKKRQRNSAGN